ncbi:MAG TPA: sigma-54-dependent Fis family transcriptional regulator, partial [Polyangiaceae bacterium]|nr:sigma-54-dependent Fis family transcriptional regulator [Polyangiaceae bacterium]
MNSDSWDLATMPAPGTPAGEMEETYALIVRDGPQSGLRFAFNGTRGMRVLVGKGPACELRLEDPMISRRHAAFEIGAKGLRVTDLDSTNGTTVNGVPIGEAYVRDGDRVRVAETTLAIEHGAPRSVPLANEARFGRMLGVSAVMRRLYPLCWRFAQSELPVLIEGETGTGKEVLAEAIHEASSRAKGPFVVFDCTAVPPSLAESMLFGHERGAFTGAIAARKGVFEEAHGGTLFIDELGELDASLQPKLLRALERSEVQRVGSNQWMRVDVRIIAATR